MGTSAANGTCQRKWVAPMRIWASAVQGRSVACSSEKGVQKPFRDALALVGVTVILGGDFLIHPVLGTGDVIALLSGFFYGMIFFH